MVGISISMAPGGFCFFRGRSGRSFSRNLGWRSGKRKCKIRGANFADIPALKHQLMAWQSSRRLRGLFQQRQEIA